MSALENQIASEPASGGLPASAPESVAGADASPSSAPAPAASESRRDIIERIAKSQVGKPRDESGKFSASRSPQSDASNPSTEAVIPTVPERPSMPKSYKKELESHWGAIPQEFAAAVAQRETDYEKGVAPLKERARMADEFMSAVKPFESMIRAEGGNPIGAVKDLLHTASVLRDPAQRVPAIAGLMQQYQVSIEDLQQALAGNGSPQSNLNPQYVSQLVKQELTSYQQQQSEEQTFGEIEKFAADPANAHYEAVVDWIPGILDSQKFIAEHRGKSAQDKLKAAYDLAVRVDPIIWDKVQAQQQAASRTSQQVTQAKNAAVQVKGAPNTGPAQKIDPSDRRALITSLVKTRR